MAVPESSNLTIEQGADFEAVFIVPINSPPASLLQSTALSKIRKHPTSVKYTSFFTTVNANSRSVKISLPASETLLLSPGRNIFDVFLNKEGKSYKIVKGTILVEQSATYSITLDGNDEGDTIIPRNLSDLYDVNVNDTNKKDKYVLVFDSSINKYVLVNPDEVLNAAAETELTQPGLVGFATAFLDRLDQDLDNRIDIDEGFY